jgi:DNA-binding SARP family transcriptional activator
MRVSVRLLGRASIGVGGERWEPPAMRRSALLYYLAVTAGWVSRSDLLYLLWPDTEERKSQANLRQVLKATRALPYAVGLEVEWTRVRWVADTDLHGASPLPAAWPGDLLEGFQLPSAPEFESWLEIERADWRNRYRAGLLHAQGTGANGAASGAALDDWLTRHPLDEEALRVWLRDAAASGRRGAEP